MSNKVGVEHQPAEKLKKAWNFKFLKNLRLKLFLHMSGIFVLFFEVGIYSIVWGPTSPTSVFWKKTSSLPSGNVPATYGGWFVGWVLSLPEGWSFFSIRRVSWYNGVTEGSFKFGPILGGIKQCNIFWMILRDFPLVVPCLGWCPIMTPCNG